MPSAWATPTFGSWEVEGDTDNTVTSTSTSTVTVTVSFTTNGDLTGFTTDDIALEDAGTTDRSSWVQNLAQVGSTSAYTFEIDVTSLCASDSPLSATIDLSGVSDDDGAGSGDTTALSAAVEPNVRVEAITFSTTSASAGTYTASVTFCEAVSFATTSDLTLTGGEFAGSLSTSDSGVTWTVDVTADGTASELTVTVIDDDGTAISPTHDAATVTATSATYAPELADFYVSGLTSNFVAGAETATATYTTDTVTVSVSFTGAVDMTTVSASDISLSDATLEGTAGTSVEGGTGEWFYVVYTSPEDAASETVTASLAASDVSLLSLDADPATLVMVYEPTVALTGASRADTEDTVTTSVSFSGGVSSITTGSITYDPASCGSVSDSSGSGSLHLVEILLAGATCSITFPTTASTPNHGTSDGNEILEVAYTPTVSTDVYESSQRSGSTYTGSALSTLEVNQPEVTVRVTTSGTIPFAAADFDVTPDAATSLSSTEYYAEFTLTGATTSITYDIDSTGGANAIANSDETFVITYSPDITVSASSTAVSDFSGGLPTATVTVSFSGALASDIAATDVVVTGDSDVSARGTTVYTSDVAADDSDFAETSTNTVYTQIVVLADTTTTVSVDATGTSPAATVTSNSDVVEIVYTPTATLSSSGTVATPSTSETVTVTATFTGYINSFPNAAGLAGDPCGGEDVGSVVSGSSGDSELVYTCVMTTDTVTATFGTSLTNANTDAAATTVLAYEPKIVSLSLVDQSSTSTDHSGEVGTKDAVSIKVTLTGPSTLDGTSFSTTGSSTIGTPAAGGDNSEWFVDLTLEGHSQVFTLNAANCDPPLQADVSITVTYDAPIAVGGTATTDAVENTDSGVFDIVTLTDDDTDDVSSVTIVGTDLVSGETLALSYSGFTGSFSTDTLTITRDAGAGSALLFQYAIQNVTVNIPAGDPTDHASGNAVTTREYEIDVTDALGFSSETVTVTATVDPVNDASTITVATATVTFTEDGSAVTITDSFTIADDDDATSSSIVVSIDNPQTGDEITWSSAASNVAFTATSTSVITIDPQDATFAQISADLDLLTFENTEAHPSITTRNISIVVTDDDGGTGTATTTTAYVAVEITPVNDAPSITTSGSGPIDYTEDDGQVSIGSIYSFSISDDDDTEATAATVTITTSCVSSEDVLGLADGSTAWNATYASGTCALTLAPTSGTTASFSSLQTALALVYYENTNDENPDETSRVVTVVVTDNASSGELTSSDEEDSVEADQIDIDVTKANDAPTISFGNTNQYNRDAATTNVSIAENTADGVALAEDGTDFVISLADVDDTGDTLTIAMGSISGNPSDAVFELVSAGGDTYTVSTKTRTADGSGSDERTYDEYLDYENVDNKWSAYDEDNHAFAMEILADDGTVTTTATFYYTVTDVNDPPRFVTTNNPTTVASTATGTVATGTQVGFGNPKVYYRSNLNTSLTNDDVDSLVRSAGGVFVDSVTADMDPSSNSWENDTQTYRKLDFIAGRSAKFAFAISDIVTDDDEADQDITLSLNLVGTKYESDSSWTAADESITSAGYTGSLFRAFNPLKWSCNTTYCVLSGTPVLASTQSLQAEYGSRVSQERNTLKFQINATDDGTGFSGTATKVYEFLVDIEVAGCLNMRASYVDDITTNRLTATTGSATNIGSFFQSGARDLEASYVSSNAPANENGNYNEKARVPSGDCIFPAVTVSTATGGTLEVGAGSSADSFDDLEASLTNLTGDALTAAAEAARGSAKITIGAGALASDAQIEVGGLDDESASDIPSPAGDETVTTDLVLKFEPCGTQFEEPIEVCIFVGPNLSGGSEYFVMYHASQVDCDSDSLGYQNWESTTENTYNSDTGKLCGKISSFSLVAGVAKSVPSADFLPARTFSMGGGCPSSCSGHGHCRSNSKCFCFSGWAGFDCSLRECATAPAWGVNSEIVRQPVECAAAGVCNRGTGECECFDGFEGAACDRQACPNHCSGHGKCRYISELPDVPSTYSDWDADRLTACVCDGSYSGSDCSQRACPRGDDPQTICDGSTAQMVQTVTLSWREDSNSVPLESGSDELALVFTTIDGVAYTTARISNIWTDADSTTGDQSGLITAIEEAFTGLPNFVVDSITVTLPTTFDSTDTTSNDLVITFTFSGDTTTGNQPLIQCPSSLGCSYPGCAPLYSQPRLAKTTIPATASSTDVSLATPFDVIPPSGYSGVRTTVTLAEAGDGTTIYWYMSVSVEGLLDANLANSTADTSWGTRRVPVIDYSTESIDLGNGLQLVFDEDLDFTATTGGANAPVPGSYIFEYHTMQCETAIASRAGDNYESSECAGRGLCNRDSGLCECFEGYAGYNCASQAIVV